MKLSPAQIERLRRVARADAGEPTADVRDGSASPFVDDPTDSGFAPAMPPLGGRFEVGEQIAFGGMGAVYRGFDRQDGRTVAIKIAHHDEGPLGVRFAREARSVAQVRHPNLVGYVHHGKTDDGVPFLVMDHVEGQTLAELMDAGRMMPVRATAIARDVARGLGALHATSRIHRDVKPANIIVSAHHAVLLDLGLVLEAGATAFTTAGKAVGTLGYLAPEQAEARPDIDARVDVFALGCTLYQCLTGRAPFPVGGVVALLGAHQRPAPPVRVALPPGLEGLLMAMLSVERGGRPADGNQVATELDRILGASAPSPRVAEPARLSRVDEQLASLDALTLWGLRLGSILGLEFTDQELASLMGQGPLVSTRRLLERAEVAGLVHLTRDGTERVTARFATEGHRSACWRRLTTDERNLFERLAVRRPEPG